jgi:hypothetical protein
MAGLNPADVALIKPEKLFGSTDPPLLTIYINSVLIII